MLLTAYDTQKLQQMYSYYAADAEMAEKASIYGALTLYLDFDQHLPVCRPPAGQQPPPQLMILNKGMCPPGTSLIFYKNN